MSGFLQYLHATPHNNRGDDRPDNQVGNPATDHCHQRARHNYTQIGNDIIGRENPGSKLQTAVTKKPSELKAGSKDAKRRKSFCARMSGVDGPMKDEKGRPTAKAKALSRWNCEESAMDYTAKRLANKDDGKVAKLRAAGDKRREEKMKGRDIAKRDTYKKNSWGDLLEVKDTEITQYFKGVMKRK